MHGNIELEAETYIYAKIQDMQGAHKDSIGLLSTRTKPCEILTKACRRTGIEESTLVKLHPDTIWVLLSAGKLTCRISSGLKQTELANSTIDCEWVPTKSFNRVSSYLVNDSTDGAIAKAILTRNPRIVDQLMQNGLLDEYTLRKLAPVIHQDRDDHLYNVPHLTSFYQRGPLAEIMKDKKFTGGQRNLQEPQIESQSTNLGQPWNTGKKKGGYLDLKIEELEKEARVPKQIIKLCCNQNKEEKREKVRTKNLLKRTEEKGQVRPKLVRLHGIDTVDGSTRKAYTLRKTKHRKTL